MGGLSKAKLIDMEKKFATAGPNKQMYEMYNMSLRSSHEGPGGLGSQGPNTGGNDMNVVSHQFGPG